MKKNNIYQFFNTKGFLLIILLAFIIRLVFFVSLQPWNKDVIEKKILFGDAVGYHKMALGLISEKSFSTCGSSRTPIYPIFLAACYLISGNTIWFALFVQIIVNLLTLLIAYKLAIEFFPKKIALLTLLLLAIDYHQAELSVRLLTETLFSFIFLVSIYFLCKSLRRKQVFQFTAISGFCLGIATLTRPISFLFPLVAVFFIIGYTFFTKKDVTARLKIISSVVYSSLFVGLFLLVITPWLYRNYVLYNELKLSSLSGVNMLFYNVAITEAGRTGNSIEKSKAYYMRQAYESGADTIVFHSFKNSKIYSEIAMKYIKNNFFLYCKSHLRGMLNLFYDPAKFSLIKKQTGIAKYRMAGFLIYFPIIYLFTIVGISLLIKRRYIIVLLFLLIIIYFVVITGVVGGSRYRVPIMPYINILCAVGLFYFYDKIIAKISPVKN